MQYEPTVEYIPFNINQGNLPSLLTEFELSEISTSYKRSDWVHLESTVPILVKPLFVLVKPRRTLLSENFHTPMDSFHCWLYEAV